MRASALEHHAATAAWLDAAAAGDIARMAALLAADPTLVHAPGRCMGMPSTTTALHLSVWHNRSDACTWLLDVARANIEQRDGTGATPLLVDIERAGIQTMRPFPLFRSRRIDVNSRVELAKYTRQFVRDRSTYATMDTSTLALLLARGADVNQRRRSGETPLLMAVADGLIKHVQLLIAAGADVHVRDASGRSALELAGVYGYADVARALVSKAPDLVVLAGEQALVGAVEHDFPAVLDELLARVLATRSAHDRAALCGRLLHVAVEFDAPACVRALVTTAPASLTWRDARAPAATALHLACQRHRMEIARTLIARGARGDLEVADASPSRYTVLLQPSSSSDGVPRIDVLRIDGADIELLDSSVSYETRLCWTAEPSTRQAGVAVLEPLVQTGGRFVVASVDAVAPILAAWVHAVAPDAAPVLLETLVLQTHGASDKWRRVVEALTWTRHTETALLVALLTLLAQRRSQASTLRVVLDWTRAHRGSVVVETLLQDVLLSRT